MQADEARGKLRRVWPEAPGLETTRFCQAVFLFESRYRHRLLQKDTCFQTASGPSTAADWPQLHRRYAKPLYPNVPGPLLRRRQAFATLHPSSIFGPG